MSDYAAPHNPRPTATDGQATAAQEEQTSLLQLLLRHNFTGSPSRPLPKVPMGTMMEPEYAPAAHPQTYGPLNASILGTETQMIERRRHTIYKVLVGRGIEQWWKFHRYQDFRDLRLHLRPYAASPLPVFPGRKWWFTDNFSPAFVAQRSAGLNTWLAAVMADSSLQPTPPLRSFLGDTDADRDERYRQANESHDPSRPPSRMPVEAEPTEDAQTWEEAEMVAAADDEHTHRPRDKTLPSPPPSSPPRPLPQPPTRAPAAPATESAMIAQSLDAFYREMAENPPLPSAVTASSSAQRETGESPAELHIGEADDDEGDHDHDHDTPSSGQSRRTSISSTDKGKRPASRIPYGQGHRSRPRAGSNAAKQRQQEVGRKRAKSRARVTGLDDFTLLRVVGSGSYGKVMLARHKASGKVYAVKALAKKHLAANPQEALRVMSERNVLKANIRHPFLLGLRYSFQSAHKLYFCVDYVNGGELFFHLQREGHFSEDRVRFYTMEMVSAIEYLHARGYVYRDLKPENCLLDSHGHVRIVDFGLAKNIAALDAHTTSTFCGTPEYLAPEVLQQKPYGHAVDWYCLGTLVYEMLVGLPPFYSQDHAEMYQKILNDKLRFPRSMHPAAKAFCTRMLERRPERRLGSGPGGAEEIKRHPFFEGIDWERVQAKGYDPPFKPQVEGTMDLRNFDPEFTGEKIPKSMLLDARQHGTGLSMALAEREARSEPDIIEFPGFSFNGEASEELNSAASPSYRASPLHQAM